MSMSGESFDLDEVFKVLSAERCRVTLSILSNRETALRLPDLAEEVAVWEFDAPLTEISAEKVQLIYFDLYHAHIPKLVDIGVIDYHQEKDLVSPAASLDRLVSFLHAIDEKQSTNDSDCNSGNRISHGGDGG